MLLVPDAAAALPPWAVLVYAAAVGVGIDLDHFLVAWLNTGELRALRYGLGHPRALLFDQSKLFAGDEITSHERLLGHAVVIGVAVPAVWAVDGFLGLVTAVVLYGHVLADLIWEVYRERTGAVAPR